jgi:hypothetical protein
MRLKNAEPNQTLCHLNTVIICRIVKPPLRRASQSVKPEAADHLNLSADEERPTEKPDTVFQNNKEDGTNSTDKQVLNILLFYNCFESVV